MRPRQRGVATRLWNGWKSTIDGWQVELEEFGGIGDYPIVQLREYLDFTEFELAEFRDYQSFRAALNHRRDVVNERINDSKMRARVHARVSAGGTLYGHGLGAGGSYLPDGVYVYMAVAFNHGAGAWFAGYLDTEPDAVLTYIEDWE